MANDAEMTNGAADKGKAKAADPPKDSKPAADGKKDDAKLNSEELSEEDQQLKNELDMLVERLTESDASLYKPALEAMATFIKTSTSSMTAVPKPLKFLRPHYETLTKLYDAWPQSDDQIALADVLSVIAMTYSDEDCQDTLKYRLLAPSSDIASWGHEYVRHLALEIGIVYGKRPDDDDAEDLTDLALVLVPLFLKSNAEADAVDLLSELEIMHKIADFVDENSYTRVCLYMVSMVNLLMYPDNELFLNTAMLIYCQYKDYTQAMVLAIRLNQPSLIKHVFSQVQDPALQKQLGFMVARQRILLDREVLDLGSLDADVADCFTNMKLVDHYRSLGKELNVLEPKSTDDVYKPHLESARVAGMTNIDSVRHNLAAAFVNGFVNAGFGNDKMMLVEDNSKSWVWKTKNDGMLSTVASIGLLMLWDVENGLDQIDKYTWAKEPEIEAGAMLAIGVMSSGLQADPESQPAMALLTEDVKWNHKDISVRTSCIMGLGLAYAGSQNAKILEFLLPLISDPTQEMQISAMAALSAGMLFVGSSHAELSETIVQTLLDPDRQPQLINKWARFMVLGLGLVFFGKQEEVDVILETLKAVDHPMAGSAVVLAEICAWAGTGAVLKIQELLHKLNEHIDATDEKRGDELLQPYAVLGIALVAMGEDIGQEMVLRHFGHLMHYGEANIRRAVPLAMALVSVSNPQMKIYDTLSRYTHDNDSDVAINAIFAMGLLGAGTNNSRLATLLRQLASFYYRDQEALFMVRIAQGLLHMGKGTLSLNPFNTDRQILSNVSAAGILAVLVAMLDAKQFITSTSHHLLYFFVTAMHPRFLVTLDEDLNPIKVNVRVGQAVDVVGQAGRPKTITGWQTQSTPVVLKHGERAELEDEQYKSLSSTMEGLVILRKNPDWEESK
jgi:26S proteasome regulatory subunit N1